MDKTDIVDAVAAARALLAEPTLGSVQTLEVYDPLVARIEVVLEHRRMLVTERTLVRPHVQDEITKLPVEIRDQLTTNGMIEGRLRRLEAIDTAVVSTLARVSVVVAGPAGRPGPRRAASDPPTRTRH